MTIRKTDNPRGVLKALEQRPWLMQPERLEALAHLVAAGGELAVGDQRVADLGRREAAGAIAVIPILGPIDHRTTWFMRYFGGTAITDLRKALREAVTDPAVSTIVLDIDSPGGAVDGTQEFADELFAVRGTKRVVAVANTMAASAAYWIGSQADEFVISPSGEAGSIGVWTLHVDYSKALEAAGITVTVIRAGERKIADNPWEPLPDEARQDIQARVDQVHRDFIAAVARGRGVLAEAVRNSYGDGRMFAAKQAVKLGLADRVATLDQVLVDLARGRRGRRADADSAPPFVAGQTLDAAMINEIEAAGDDEAAPADRVAADLEYLDLTLALARAGGTDAD